MEIIENAKTNLKIQEKPKPLIVSNSRTETKSSESLSLGSLGHLNKQNSDSSNAENKKIFDNHSHNLNLNHNHNHNITKKGVSGNEYIMKSKELMDKIVMKTEASVEKINRPQIAKTASIKITKLYENNKLSANTVTSKALLTDSNKKPIHSSSSLLDNKNSKSKVNIIAPNKIKVTSIPMISRAGTQTNMRTSNTQQTILKVRNIY